MTSSAKPKISPELAEFLKLTEIRCQKCKNRIDDDRLDPRQKWICARCNDKRLLKLRRRGRMFYRSGKIPFVKMPIPEKKQIDWKAIILGKE